MENKEILNILQKAAGAKFSFNSKGELWFSGSIAHCNESEGISDEKYNDEVYPKMKSLLESIPWTKTVENPRNPKENEYPEENGWYITMLDCNEHGILVNRFEKGDSGWSFYNKTHVKWWMPLTDELKHEITEIITYSCNNPEEQVAPTKEKNSGCEHEDEGKTNTVTKVDENKKIEEICDYIFKYEHYNSFYQYAVACAKAVAEWKNREITELKNRTCRYDYRRQSNI